MFTRALRLCRDDFREAVSCLACAGFNGQSSGALSSIEQKATTNKFQRDGYLDRTSFTIAVTLS